MIGFSDFLDGSLTAQLGYDWNVPFDRMRRLQWFIGAHSHIFLPATVTDRTTFLAGLRSGLEINTNPSRGGARFSLYGEGGIGSFGLPESSVPGAPTRQTSPYLLGGGSIGYRTAPSGGSMWDFSADVGFGSTLRDQSVPGAVPNSRWFTGGFSIGYHFH